MRKTKSVDALLKLFQEPNKAISIGEFVEALRGEMNRTTVYRILDRLEKNGTLHSFVGKDGVRWYALWHGSTSAAHHHPHFQCKECGKMECLSDHLAIPSIPDYKTESVSLLFIGSCRDCCE